jgi:hypothetical protein
MSANGTAVAVSQNVSFAEMQRLAASIVKSNMFGIKDVDQAVALMSIAVAEGRHPATIARDFDIIQGRQVKKAEAMQRDSLAAGMRIEWHENTDEACEATFSHPHGGTVRIRWDIARAQRAGLTNKDNWKRYPRSMLRARVISEGCRTVCPMATSGMYTPEEAVDMEPVNVTPPQRIDEAVASVAAAHPLTEDERFDHVLGMQEATDAASLRSAFSAAWKHASEAKDESSKCLFKATYDGLKPAAEVTP